jgi:hypothetical protein
MAELRTLLGLGDRRRRASVPPATATAAAAPTVPLSAQPPAPANIPTLRAPKPQPAIAAAADEATVVRAARKRATRPIVAVVVLLLVVIGAAAYFFLEPAGDAPRPADQQAALPKDPDTPVKSAPAPDRPAVAAPGPFSAELMLRQVFEGRDPQHAVTASPDVAQARIGQDSLRFSIRSTKPGYIYVLALGTRDSDFELVFPNAADAGNHLDAGEVRRLPGAKWSLPARGPAGTSRFVAIVSDEPRDFASLGTLPAGAFRRFSLEAGARLLHDYTGKAPLYAGQVRCEGAGSCSQSYGAATFSIDQVEPGPAQAGSSEPATTQAPNTKAAPERVKAPPSKASPSPSTKIGSKPECVEILQRASLGEALSAAEQATLKEECR